MAFDTKAQVNISAQVSGQQAVDNLAKAINQVGASAQISAKQTAQAFRLLPAQFSDIAVQLGSGQNPFLILLQQGAQIKDSFGGFGPMFRNLATLITPAKLAVAGFGTAAVLIGKAAYDADKQFTDFNKSLALTGNTAGITWEQYLKLGDQISKASGATIGMSREIAAAAVATGSFGSKSIGPAVEAMARLQKISGESAKDIAKDFASMSSDVAGWAASHNKAYGYLTLSTFNYIKELQSQGRTEEAMKVNMDAFNNTMKAREPVLGTMASLWKTVGEWASWAGDQMEKPFRKSTSTELKEALKTRIREMEEYLSVSSNTVDRTPVSNRLAAARMRLKSLEEEGIAAEKWKKVNEDIKASEKKAIEDEASGRNDRKRVADAESYAQSIKRTADQEISDLTRKQQQTASLRERMLIDQVEFINRSTQNELDQIAQQKKTAQAKAATITATKPKDFADEAERAVKLQAITDEISALDRKAVEVKEKGSLDALAAQEELARERLTKGLEAQAIAYRQSTDSKIEDVQREKNELEALRDKQLISEREYIQKSNKLIVEELQLKKKKAEEDATLAALSPARGEIEILARQNKVNTIKAEIAALEELIKTQEAQGANKLSVSQDKFTREQKLYNGQLEQSNELLRAQAKEVQMTDFQYKQYIDTLNLEFEIRQRALKMSKEEAAVYEAIQREKFAEKQKIEKDNYDASRTPLRGAQDAVKNYNKEVSNSAKLTEQAFTRAFKATEDALVEFAMTGKLNFEQLANSIIKDLIRIQIQQSVMKPLSDFVGSIAQSWFGVPSGVNASAGTASVPANMAANGAWFDGSTAAFANGGVFNKPTFFKFASGGALRNGVLGEAGPEAILPLRRNSSGQLGVVSDGSKTSVVINNYSTERAQAKETVDSRGNRRIEVSIGELVAGEVRRAGSAANAAIRETFGARPALVGR